MAPKRIPPPSLSSSGENEEDEEEDQEDEEEDQEKESDEPQESSDGSESLESESGNILNSPNADDFTIKHISSKTMAKKELTKSVGPAAKRARGKRVLDQIGSNDLNSKNCGFGLGCSSDCLSDARPETWWSDYGKEFPELQKLAIRILSQTCNGGSRFGLTRELAEIMLTQESNPAEIWRIGRLTWVHYNLHLQNFEARRHKGILADKIMGMDDWVGKRQALSVDEQLSIFNPRSEAYGAGPL